MNNTVVTSLTGDSSTSRAASLLSRPLVHLTLILLVAIVSYSNTFKVPFQFDDRFTIVENPLVTDVSNIPLILSGSKGRFASRPILHTTIALNFYFGGYDTRGYHAANLFLHLLNGVLLYFLIVMTGRRMGYAEKTTRLTAVFSTVLFVLHPVQTETVTNIVNRSMLLAAAFYLSGLMLFLKAVTAEKRRPLYIAGLFVASLLGMGSRENFATFPLVLFLYDLFFISRFSLRETIKHWKAYLPVLLSLGYLAFLAFHHTYERSINFPGVGVPSADYFRTQFNVHWSYLRLLVLPLNQNLDYDYPIARTLFEFPALISLIGYLALLAASILFAKRRPVISFSVLWFLITLVPISFLVTFMGLRLDDVIFEHRLYLPSVGPLVALAAIAACLIAKLQGAVFRTAAAAILVVLSLTLAAASYQRNSVWRTEFSMWEDVIRKSPGKARGYNNLGMLYGSVGLNDKAIEKLEVAVKLDPDYARAHFNLGLTYMQKNRVREASEQFAEAVRVDPNDLQARQFLQYTLKIEAAAKKKR